MSLDIEALAGLRGQMRGRRKKARLRELAGLLK
jgi:hypothetical protein